MSKLANVSDVAVVRLPLHGGGDGALMVLEGPHGAVPFSIARVFVVRSGEKTVRGQHAHKRCVQLLVCVHGRCDVACTDGTNSRVDTLDRMNTGLLVPAGIWAEERYAGPDTLLMVTCDRPYEKDDYIHEYDSYVAYRAGMKDSQ